MRLSELPEIDETLRPYQIAGKKDIYRAWDSCRTVLFQMPTGTGKTRLFSSIIRDIRRQGQEEGVRKRVLVLAHRTELIQQIDETLSFKYGISHGIIKSGVEETWNRTVQVASVQTIVRRLTKWSEKDFSYIIIDEAHHAVSSTYLRICKQFPEAKILGVTATPCRLTGDALRKLFGVLVISQPVSKFIEQGYLSPYSYYSIKPNSRIQLSLDNISHFNIDGDYAESDMMRILDTKTVRANIVQAYLKYAKGKKGIIYTINQEHNKHICEAFEKIGVSIKSIDSKTPAEERQKTVAAFRAGKIDIICNVNIFSEGFDCPDIEFIQLARPTCSLAMYLQQVGRGLRPHPKGIPATILDNVGSYNKFGLPSANRKWRSHFEGEGQRVTRSQNTPQKKTGEGMKRSFREGDEEMTLIFSGKALNTPDTDFLPILQSISRSREWFPLGYEALIDPYQHPVLQSFRRIKFYGLSEVYEDWIDDVEMSLEGLEEEEQNQNRLEELKWVLQRIHNTFRFYHKGKCGLVYLRDDPETLPEDIKLYAAGKKPFDEIASILLMPVYDEIGCGDNRDFAICKKDGQYGVIAGESMTIQVPFDYDSIGFQVTGEYVVEKGGKKGVINDSGEVLIPLEYDYIVESLNSDDVFFFADRKNRYEVFFRRDNKYEPLPVRDVVLKGLEQAYYVRRLNKSYGAICNSSGEVLFPHHIDSIGVIDHSVKNSRYYLEADGFYAILDDRLRVVKNLTDQKLSHDEVFKTFSLTRAYAFTSTDIKSWQEETKSRAKTTVRQDDASEAKAGKTVSATIPESKPQTPKVTVSKPESEKPKKSPRRRHRLPDGVFEGDDGLLGFALGQRILLDPEYEFITPYGDDRLIVRKKGKDGVFALEKGEVSEVVPCIFKSIEGTSEKRYKVRLFSDYYEEHSEPFLKTVLYQTQQHLVVRTKDGKEQIRFQSKEVAEYREVIPVAEGLFIAINDYDKYGLIRCSANNTELIRPFEYSMIGVSKDKRNILLTKTGRPRFIPIHSLLKNV
jgi:superfamily II DNA or RNA helicase